MRPRSPQGLETSGQLNAVFNGLEWTPDEYWRARIVGSNQCVTHFHSSQNEASQKYTQVKCSRHSKPSNVLIKWKTSRSVWKCYQHHFFSNQIREDPKYCIVSSGWLRSVDDTCPDVTQRGSAFVKRGNKYHFKSTGGIWPVETGISIKKTPSIDRRMDCHSLSRTGASVWKNVSAACHCLPVWQAVSCVVCGPALSSSSPLPLPGSHRSEKENGTQTEWDFSFQTTVPCKQYTNPQIFS